MSHNVTFEQWLTPFTVEHLIPYWKLQTLDHFIQQRSKLCIEKEYIAYIPDDDTYEIQWFSYLNTLKDTITTIYPEAIFIRDINGHYVNVRLYRCLINI